MDNELLKKKELEGEYSEQQKAKELQNMQTPLLPPGERIEAFDKEMKTPVALSDETKQEAAKRGLGRAFGQSMYDVDKQYKEDPSSVGDYINKLSEARQSDVQYARMKTFKDFLADGQTQQYIKSPEIQNLIKAASASESPEERDHIASRVYWLLQGKYSQSDYAKNANEFEKRSGGSLQDTALKYQLDNFNADVLNQIDSGGEVSEKSNRNLRAANHFINESKRLINNAESGSGILKGAGDAIFDPNTWTLGISDLSRTLKIKDIADKYDRGEKLTVDENALMDALALNLAANSFYSSKLPKQYKWGQIAGESLPFMVEFILNPVASAGSGLAKTIAKRAISKFAATGARKTAIKAGERIIGDAIGAAGMTLTTGAPGTVADAINRNLGQASYDYDEDGKIVYTGHEGGDNAVTSALKAAGANFLEYQSEMVGASGIGSLVGKSIPKGWVKSIKASEFGKSVGALKKSKLYQESKALMRRGQWSGTVGEYGEEVYNQFMNALLIGDNKMSDLTDIDRQVDTFMGLALTGGVMGTINTAAYIKDRSRTAGKLNEADRKSSEYFQEWDVIKSQLKDFSVDERSQSIKDVLKRTDIPNEAKKSFADYISALTYRDSLIGADSQIKKENKDLAEQNGREMIINPRLKKVLSTVNQEKMELESRLGDITTVPEDQIEAFIESGMITPEQLDDLNTYNQRLAEYEGVVQQLREEIDMQMGPVQEDIQRVSRRDGSVIYADFSGEGRLPIINGNVSQKPDGSIDVQSSDKSLTVLMPDGRRRMISSKFIAGNVQVNTPNELIDEARQRAYQAIVTPIEEEMTGSKKFAEGDPVEYIDEKGQVQAGSVASLQGNTVTVVPNDGNKSKIKTFTQEQLRASLVAETLGNIQVRDEFPVNIPQGYKLSPNLIEQGYRDIRPGAYNVQVTDISDQRATLRFIAPGETDQFIEATLDDINSLMVKQPQAEATHESMDPMETQQEQVTVQAESAPAEKVYPVDKDGNIDFDKITDGNQYASALQQEFGDDAIGIAEEYKKNADSDLNNISRIKDPIKRKREEIKRQKEVDRWDKILQSLKPALTYKDRIESISTGKIKDRESNMGEYLSLRDYLLRNIASGRYKFAWNDINGTRGLKNEVFASRNTESERKKRISFLDNNGYTPETLAHEIWENAGQGTDINEDWIRDINEIRNEIIDIMLSYDTPTSMIDEAANLRQDPENAQEYEESIDPALIFEYEANEASQDEMLRSLPTLELHNTISDAEVDAYFSQQTSEEEFNNYINSITFEQNNIQHGTDPNTGTRIGGNQPDAGQDSGAETAANDQGRDRGSIGSDQDQQASDIPLAGEATITGERSAQESVEQPITEGAVQEPRRPAERQDGGIEPIDLIESARKAVERNNSNPITNENQNEQASETRLDNRPAVEGGTIGTVVGGQPQTVGINRTIQASNSAGSVRADHTAEELEELESRGLNPYWDKPTFHRILKAEAQKNDVWLEKSYLSGKTLLHDQKTSGTSENDMYLNPDGKAVTKLNNLSYVKGSDHHNNLNSFIDRINAHNALFPDLAYTIVGFMENENGFPAMVLEQPFISDVKENAAQDEINEYLTYRGFKLDGSRPWSNEHRVWSNGVYELFDARPANVLKGNNGELYFIDTVPHSVEYMNKINYKSFPDQATLGENNQEELSDNIIDKSDNEDDDIITTDAKLTKKENIEQQSVNQKGQKSEPIDIVKVARDAVKKDQESYIDKENNITFAKNKVNEKRQRYTTKDGRQLEFSFVSTNETVQSEEFETDNITPGSGDVQREENPLQNKLGRLKPGEFSHVERVFTEKGYFDFTGPERIETIEDVASIFDKLEDSAIENSFAVFIKDSATTVQHLGMGDFHSASVNVPAMVEAANRINPDSIYLVHNHPSGALYASAEDMRMLGKLRGAFGDKMQDGIIINLKSGKFVTFNEMESTTVVKAEKKNEIPIKTYSFDKQVFEKDYNPDLLSQIRSSEDVAKFISSHRLGEREKLSFLVLNRANRIVGNFFTSETDLTDENSSSLVDYMLSHAITYGGSNVIIYGGFYGAGLNSSNTRKIKRLFHSKSGGVIDVFDAIAMRKGESDYMSAGDEGLLEEGVSYIGSTIEIDGVERPTTNSEGNLIAQTEEGIRNFWKWFGDSKVVDEDGRPLVVYHGTDAEFNEFIPSKRGIWLTPNKERAKGYAQNRTNNSGSEIIMPLYANIKNPLDQETNENYVPYNKLGHDGWISKFPDGRMFTVVVENSNQIKSVENVGSFDPGSDDIRLRTAQKEIKGINGILNVSDLRAVQNRFDNPANETEKYNAAIDMVSIIETMFNSDARTIVVRDKKGMANVLRNYGISEERALYYENYDGRVQGMFFRGVVIINSTDNTDSMDLLDTWVHETRHDYNSKNPEEVLSLLGNIPDELYSEVLPDEYIKLDETDKLDELLSFLTEKAINNEQLPDYNIVREQIQPLINNYLNKITDGRYQNYQNVHRERRVTETSYGDIERGTRQADRIAGQGTDTGKPGTNDGAGRYSRERNGEIVSKLFDNADNLKSVIPNYPKFLGDVFNGPGKESILAEAKNIGVDKLGKAIENYLSQVDTPEELQRIKGLLGVEMPDNALRYLLWRNVNPDDGSVVWKAKDAVKRDEMRGDVLFRMGDEPTVSQLQQYEQITKSKWFAFEQEYFNDMLSLRTIQEIITGKKEHEIPGRNNPYKIFKLYRSRAHEALKMYTKHIYDPMIKSLAKNNEVLEKAGMQSIKSDLQGNKSQYLHVTVYALAKSGLSRTKWMARRDADSYKQTEMNKISVLALDDVDYEKALNKIEKNTEKLYNEYLVRDVSGLTALANLVGREDENFLDVANSIVAESERILGEETVNDLWDQIRESNHWVLQKEYESGKMTKEQYEWYLNTDEFYLPHRGYDVTTAGDKYSYLERAEGDFNSLFKHAKGRTSLAENPFAHIASMAASGILEAEKNRSKQAIYRMVVMNPNNIVTVRDVWTQNMGTGEIPDWREVFPETKETDTPDQVRDKITAFEDKMNRLAAEGMAKLKINQLNLGVPIGKGNASEHAIRVWTGGQEKVLYVNGNPVLAQAVNGLFDRKRNDEMQKFINSVKNVNRFMSGAYTSYNPEFGVTNGLKDAHAALAFSYVEHGFGFSARLFKNLLYGSKAVANYTWTGRFSGNQYGRYMEEFMKSGGPTGFTFIKNIDSYSKDMQKLYKKSVGSVDYRMVPKIVAKAIENFNQMIELNTRFATYVTARESGFDITDSSYNAKNITINFEQHGAAQGFVARYLRDYVIFSNAALQGIYRIIEAGRRNPKRMAKIVASTFASGALMPLITNLMLSMFGDDDDKEKFANISPWIKLNNLTVYIGNGKFLTYPLSHEYRWIYGIANIGSDAIMGNLRGENIPLLMAEQLTSVVPIDAFSGMAGFVPSATKPIFELWSNKNFTGRQIYKENQWTELDPEWTKAFKHTWTPYTNASKAINKLSGGDDIKKGWADKLKIEDVPVNNPDIWQHLTRSYLGGGVEVVGNMVNLTQDIVDKAIADADNNGEVEDINLSDIPFVRRIMRESTDRDSDAASSRQMGAIYDFVKDYEHLKSGYRKLITEEEYRKKYSNIIGGDDIRKYESLKRMMNNIDKYKSIPGREDDIRETKKKMIELFWEEN